MHTLRIEQGVDGEYPSRWTPHIALATRLTHLTFGDEILIDTGDVAQLLALIPMLKSFTGLRVSKMNPMESLGLEYHGLESLSMKADDDSFTTNFRPVAPISGVVSLQSG